MSVKSLAMSAAGYEPPLAIEDVFSTYLYTGNGSTQTINNGIDLAGKGGMVWIKDRGVNRAHMLFDTNRGANNYISSNFSDGQKYYGGTDTLTTFVNSGFTLGADTQTANVNVSSRTYTSWTFRKAPKFFDVVTWTGDGNMDRQLSHSLGQTPGMIVLKCTSTLGDWYVVHRGLDSNGLNHLLLDTTGASAATISAPGVTNLTSNTSFYVHQSATYNPYWNFNATGATYVAYLFAHDTTTDGLIQCGSYVGAYPNTANIDLGWEPQYVLIKNASNGSASANWQIYDNMRGVPTGGGTTYLRPNTSEAEGTTINIVNFTATGFQVTGAQYSTNYNTGDTFIYMAIRRGPMRTPTDGTKVFSLSTTGTSLTAATKVSTGFPVDLQLWKIRSGSDTRVLDRLRGISSNSTQSGQVLFTGASTAEAASQNSLFWDNTGYQITSTYAGVDTALWNFRRAPGFFDVVCYTGNGANGQTIKHNLGVIPEFVIIKRRSAAEDWYAATISADGLAPAKEMRLNTTAASVGNIFTMYYSSTQFQVNYYNPVNGLALNTSGNNYVAYLFASCPGVSKVGSYTGNGSSQTINCGFSAGARFVLIKRTDSTGDWYVWDTARGIVAGTDPYLTLNTTAAEVNTNTDTIDPVSTGFIVNQDPTTNVNLSTATYIYLAIA